MENNRLTGFKFVHPAFGCGVVLNVSDFSYEDTSLVVVRVKFREEREFDFVYDGTLDEFEKMPLVDKRKWLENYNVPKEKEQEEFPEEFENLLRRIDYIKEHKFLGTFCSSFILFRIADGMGYSSMVKKLGSALFGDDSRIKEEVLRTGIRRNDAQFSAIIDNASRVKNAVVSFDISSWCYETDPCFEELLTKLESAMGSGKALYIFKVKPNDCLALPLLSAKAPVYEVRIDSDPEKFLAHLEKKLSSDSITVGSNTAEPLKSIIRSEMKKSNFKGFRSIDYIALRLSEFISSGYPGEKELTRRMLNAYIRTFRKTRGEPTLDKLKKMVGMEDVARKVEEMVIAVKEYELIAAGGGKSERPCLNMVLSGNPGTGKTTVARMIAKVFQENDVLSGGDILEISGRSLCGKYVGETAVITRSIVANAINSHSVLFIDEAYSLFYDGSDNDYGMEAINELVQLMENHRDELIVIFCGYPDETDAMIHYNPGLASRIPYRIELSNYSRDSLFGIFKGMLNPIYKYDGSFLNAVRSYFDSLPESLLEDREFGNGRAVRVLVEKIVSKSSRRRWLTDDNSMTLTAEDVEEAVREIESGRDRPAVRTIGFVA